MWHFLLDACELMYILLCRGKNCSYYAENCWHYPTQFCFWGNQAPGISVPLINWVYSHHGIVHSLLVNGGGSLQVLRVVAANVLNDWLQTADRAIHHLGS